MVRFSANLGFLWQQLSLPDAIRAAKQAGFDAVECHWPYAHSAADILAALEETGLTMIGLNTARGNVEAGDNGLSAVPGRQSEARAAIDQAIDYAVALCCANIHVMAGRAQGDDAHKAFIANLRYACARAAAHGITILIEPLNDRDAPGYFLRNSAQAKAIIDALRLPNLKLMFDCYHIQIIEGDISRRLEALLPVIGHVQIASVPDRAEPDQGELAYNFILSTLQRLGYLKPVGAEYRPAPDRQDGLKWLQLLRQSTSDNAAPAAIKPSMRQEGVRDE
ncbi:hydroxypyruvate isomerase family protein [Ochrobactrum sp. AN78]|uniref:hydroxypyruvate isomerase family protein n=1 Tax=Ochrobactrum sp. AN78 TaxID=3039853 RepID=UPI002989CD6E|nr:TIM barrel protein [Ochrobactrum sp. AN78]MDH7793752.1 hydroxypyruvate isomerase [Ochrobactrum sp. AN78]